MHTADSIDKIFQRQIAAFTQFRAVLLREQSALTQRNFPEIDECFVQRAQCVATLESLDHEFKTILAHAGTSQAATGMDRILATLQTDRRLTLQALWKNLQALVSECRDQNAINSRLVNFNRQNTEAALRVLKGLGSVPTATYLPDGKVSPTSIHTAITTA